MRSPNVVGRTYSLMVLTPVREGEAQALQDYLDGLPRGADSPLARVERTHMARLLIIADMPVAPERPDLADPLGGPYLLFTATFDGSLDRYLVELVEALTPEEAEAIWGRCLGCPRPVEGAALKAYIGRNQLQSGVVFAAYGDASVADVRRALDKRARLQDFVIRAQTMTPAKRRKAFLKEFGA
jgi:hypothetical protein